SQKCTNPGTRGASGCRMLRSPDVAARSHRPSGRGPCAGARVLRRRPTARAAHDEGPAMPRSQPVLSFRMFHNGQLIREGTLALGVIKIGKVPSAHLQIADDGVSRMHAIIEVAGGEVSLIALGSTRGTFVNGKRIHKARLLSGDVLTLGDTRLEL